MSDPITESTPELGPAPSVTYNHLFHKFGLIFCSEGVPILPVVLSGSQNSRCTYSPASRLSLRHLTKMMTLILVCLCGFRLCATGKYDRLHPGHRQPPHPQGNQCSRGSSPIPGRPTIRDHRARLQLALEHRILRDVCIEREDTPKGIILDVYRHGKTDDSGDQLQGPELGLAIGRPRPLQEGKGRPLRREPVRSHQGQAR